MRNVGKISGLKIGDQVRTITDIRDGARGLQVLPANTIATLGTFQRIDTLEDGSQIECWIIWVGDWPNKRIWGCCHTQLEKIMG